MHYYFNLKLFDDGASSTGDTTSADAPETIYGITDDPAAAGQDTQTANGQTVDAGADFDALIRKGGQYEQAFNDRVSSIVQRRIGDSKAMQTQLDSYKPIMDMLQAKYGQTDLAQLQAAIEEDESFFEDAAMQRGMTVEQYKQVSRLERENAAYKAAQQQQEAQLGAQQQQAAWFAEEQAIRAQYPNFDLQAEIRNPQFAAILQRGGSVTDAFRLTHYDDLMAAAQQQASNISTQRAAAALRKNAQRPIENGARTSNGQRVVSDPSALTDEDFIRIREQVRNGGNVRF